MYFIKKSQRNSPKVSFILLDWNVRESFHIFDYLEKQECARDDYEVIIIEYYSREFEGIRKYQEQVDTWIVMEMPETCYYHKHLMYNLGIVASNGEIISICDSDAMVKPSYVSSIIEAFSTDSNIVFHIDQFRNTKKEYYPFNYPTFEQVLGEGCINHADGKTSGVQDISDPIHSRNYGACMCARKKDLIDIGGADEHIDFVGHICGPYDMTFRLVNTGNHEVWSESEFMYHTWHPGSDGVDNYMGPHDGKNVSTTSLMALVSGRTLPLVENKAVRSIRLGENDNVENLIEKAINYDDAPHWDIDLLNNGIYNTPKIDGMNLVESFYGSRIYQGNDSFTVKSIYHEKINHTLEPEDYRTIEEARNAIKSELDIQIKIKTKMYKLLVDFLYFIRLITQVLRSPSILSPSRLINAPDMITRAYAVRNIFSSSMIDMIIYLDEMRETEKTTEVPVVIILDKIDAVILSIFRIFGLLPEIECDRIFNSKDVKELGTKSETESKKFYVVASTFVRFYSEFKKYEKEVIVVV
jgi:hypothetical protein